MTTPLRGCLLVPVVAVFLSNASAEMLSPEILKAAVKPAMFDEATAMAREGAFQGFCAAPGTSLRPDVPLEDFLIQNVVVDADDHVIAGNPLTAERQRDFRAGETLSYFLCDYPRAGDASDLQHRYGVPFATGHDQDGAYPVTLGLREMASTTGGGDYNTFGPRDIASMVGIFPTYGCYLGAAIPKKEGYAVSVGIGYTDPKSQGIARFTHPLYPNPVPVMGSMWYATVLQKTLSIGREKDIPSFPEHQEQLLVPQFTVGKRLMYSYGTREAPTKALDTVVVVLAYNNVNALGDAPQVHNKSTQTERIYLTRELGYATRWESWACEESTQKEALKVAQQAYAYDNCGKPADLSGKFSDHFILGPIIEDKKLGVYKQDQTIIDPITGKNETKTWYMIGCHDYTNLQPQSPIDPTKIVNPATIGPGFMKLFGVEPATP